MNEQTKITRQPWGWQKFGDVYSLTAQHGMREIILGAIKDRKTGHPVLAMNHNGILEKVNPEHPNAKFIVTAVNCHDELIETLEEFIKHPLSGDMERAKEIIKKAKQQ